MYKKINILRHRSRTPKRELREWAIMNRYQKAMLVQALVYASRGWHVVPCGYRKQPLTPHGCKDGTTSQEQIEAWWNENPKSQIGICTGRVSGFWVVDIDRKGGRDGLESLKAHFGDRFTLEEGLFQKTPTGGRHLCFAYDENNPVGCPTGVLDGVDIRGDGGYVLAAPSTLNVDGEWKEYAWKDPEAEPTSAPEWAAELIKMGNTRRSQRPDLQKALSDGLAEGVRDESLFRIACLLEREGVDLDTAKAFVATVAESCIPPFDQETAVDKVEKAYTTYATEKGIQARIAMLEKRREEMTHG